MNRQIGEPLNRLGYLMLSEGRARLPEDWCDPFRYTVWFYGADDALVLPPERHLRLAVTAMVWR